MQPYRQAPPWPRPTHAFGPGRAGKVVGALGMFALSAALVMGLGEHGHGAYMLGAPAIFGCLLLAQARSGRLVLRPEERAGEVVVRGLVRARRARFAYEDVIGTAIVRVNFLGRPADHELRLMLRRQADVALLRMATERDVEPSRTALEAFLAEHGLPVRLER